MFAMDDVTEEEEGALLAERGYRMFLDGHHVEAVALFRRAYKLGDPRGANNLGAMLENGHGVGVDKERAVSLFKYAAEEGFSRAYINYGKCLRNGSGCEQNLERSLVMFDKAQEAEGSYEAGVTLEMLGRLDEAKRYHERAADSWPAAKSALGFLLLREGNYDTAMSLFREATAEGDPRAMNNLGACLEAEGDIGAAKALFLRSAELGFPLAFANLAIYAKSLRQKIDMLTAAAQGGIVDAKLSLGRLHFEQGNYSEAVSLLKSAIQEGCTAAKPLLGRCYMQGLGVEKDTQKGATLLRVAAI